MSFRSAMALATLGNGNEASPEEIEAFFERLGEKEQLVGETAAALESLIDTRQATCAQINEYTEAALQLFAAELRIAFEFRRAGVTMPDVFFPVLFGQEVQMSELVDGKATIAINLGCPGGQPNFDVIKKFDAPSNGLRTGVTGAKGLAGLRSVALSQGTDLGALGAIPIAVWAGLAFLATAGLTFVITRTFLSESDFESAIKEETLRGILRSSHTNLCVASKLAAVGGSATPAQVEQFRRECTGESQELFPPTSSPPKEFSLTKFALTWGLVGLGGYTVFKVGRRRGWF
jgi:hypothetical protein